MAKIRVQSFHVRMMLSPSSLEAMAMFVGLYGGQTANCTVLSR